MHNRLRRVLRTPALLASLPLRLWGTLRLSAGRKPFLIAAFGLLAAVLLVLLAALWQSTASARAQQRYLVSDFNRSASLYESLGGSAALYNAANARYRAGAYERALQLYGAVDAPDAATAAQVWFNRGNALVRLKEFEKARDAYARSLALQYDEAALENMMHILHAEGQDHLLTGRQEGKKRAQDQEEESSEKGPGKAKEGGGSNQQSSAERNTGAGGRGKKAEADVKLEFSNKGQNRLSSKQYELINQRSVHETKPW